MAGLIEFYETNEIVEELFSTFSGGGKASATVTKDLAHDGGSRTMAHRPPALSNFEASEKRARKEQ
jgi:hypothetical protein